MKGQTRYSFQYINKIQELPQTEEPTTSNLLKFFKNKTKINQEFYNIRIGIKVIDFVTLQQDYIVYLANMLASETHFISAFIIDPNHLYFSMNLTTRCLQNPDIQQIGLES